MHLVMTIPLLSFGLGPKQSKAIAILSMQIADRCTELWPGGVVIGAHPHVLGTQIYTFCRNRQVSINSRTEVAVRLMAAIAHDPFFAENRIHKHQGSLNADVVVIGSIMN